MAEDGFSYRDFARMASLPLSEIARDCAVETFHAHGPGGQGVNTADSAVRMTHIPTGIVVVSRESRSQFRNRQLCLGKIRDELQRRSIRPVARRPTKPSKSSQRKRVEEKRRRSQIKRMRGKVQGEE